MTLYKVLHVLPFSPYPVRSGGAMRAFNLLRELGREFNVISLIIGECNGIQEELDAVLVNEKGNIKVISIPYQSDKPKLLVKLISRIGYSWATKTIRTSTNSTFMAMMPAIKHALSNFHPDAVIMTELQTVMAGLLVKKYRPNTVRIVDMYNVNHVLRKGEIEYSNPTEDLQYKKIMKTESNLDRWVETVFACSQVDLSTFLNFSQKKLTGFVIPNGVDCSAMDYDRNTNKHESNTVLFCGNLAYQPNRDGLLWFLQKVWPEIVAELPYLRFTVVGKGADKDLQDELLMNKTVDYIGEVTSVIPYYHAAGVTVCPLHIGSGTRLKILESMSLGNPIVSTSIGCEGIKLVDGKNILIRDGVQEFVSGVLELVLKKERFHAIRNQARCSVVKMYDWQVIGSLMNSTITKLVEKKKLDIYSND